MTLFEAIRTAHKLKNSPLHVTSDLFGKYVFITESFTVYKKAMNTIYSKNRTLYKILYKLNII